VRTCFRVSIWERKAQSKHVLTKDEKARVAKYGSYWARKYDREPSGKLALQFLHVSDASKSYGRRNDGTTRLESKLGDAASRVPRILEEIRAEDSRRAAEAQLDHLAARERASEFERERRDKELRKDLDTMIERYGQAKRIREFVDRAEPAILSIDGDADSEKRAWIVWARAYADAIDPMRSPSSIAKTLNGPSDRSRNRSAATEASVTSG